MQEWFEAGACDGFSIAVDGYHDGFDAFVDQVVPILQERGLFTTRPTLQGTFGMEVPGSGRCPGLLLPIESLTCGDASFSVFRWGTGLRRRNSPLPPHGDENFPATPQAEQRRAPAEGHSPGVSELAGDRGEAKFVGHDRDRQEHPRVVPNPDSQNCLRGLRPTTARSCRNLPRPLGLNRHRHPPHTTTSVSTTTTKSWRPTSRGGPDCQQRSEVGTVPSASQWVSDGPSRGRVNLTAEQRRTVRVWTGSS